MNTQTVTIHESAVRTRAEKIAQETGKPASKVFIDLLMAHKSNGVDVLPTWRRHSQKAGVEVPEDTGPDTVQLDDPAFMTTQKLQSTLAPSFARTQALQV
jgi:hypothetical protein